MLEVLTLLLPDECLALTKIETQANELGVAKSRRKRSLIFPTGSDLEFTVAFQIPIAALSATSKTDTFKDKRDQPTHSPDPLNLVRSTGSAAVHLDSFPMRGL